jgi:beta-lactam-binding protein with PASTA domain
MWVPRVRRAPQLLATLVLAVSLASCGGASDEPTTTGPQPAPRAQVRVPDVVGMRFGAAVRTLHRARLEQKTTGFPGTLGNPAYGTRCTAVSSEAPRPGTRVDRGSTVAIVYGACKRAIVHSHGSRG